jgi:hypothetical protein
VPVGLVVVDFPVTTPQGIVLHEKKTIVLFGSP